ncbi:hypothetical protein N7491_000474 [Penicillium cf. griseofulvum]|uniref:Uncharacterized protein n=1 Tax=Penicillium cf. griseofulvum TaxID=2972120 RepID=A0A9W9JQH1_9EURO|nr:hypothetical protein N7472_004164 [Penicillium cf. griseofulvum]KAJ5451292.1 hypothetical protein N7491_000474 [Penicillium cf. griseofulvum]
MRKSSWRSNRSDLMNEKERELPCHPMSPPQEDSSARRAVPEEEDRHDNPRHLEDSNFVEPTRRGKQAGVAMPPRT